MRPGPRPVAANLADVKKSAVKPLVGIVAAGLLLSACTPTGGSAAVVNGVQVPESLVQDTIDGCEAVGFPIVDGVSMTRAGLAFSLAAAEVARQGTAFEGVSVLPRNEVAAMLETAVPAEVLQHEECGDFIIGSTSFNLALQEMQMTLPPEQLNEAITDIIESIELNPRYGRIRPQANGELVTGTGSLSVVAGQN